MTDIVKRLQCNDPYTEPAAARDAMDDAITEIQRLRAKIEAISQVAGKASIDGGPTFAEIKDRARHPDSPVLGKYNGETNV